MLDVHIGVVFPQTELGGDVGAIRTYAQAVEQLGYTHFLAFDHVLGADPDVHKGWAGPYDVCTTFDEPFVLFGFVAALTNLELVSGVIILPQRQTALVAKQAAEVDVLSGGKLRLGIGIGWNPVEYEALGEDFSNRGARSEEQVEVMRRLWTEQSVTHEGRFEKLTGAGIAPLPVQRPIPLWFGAASPRAFRRAGRLGDGWFPMMGPGPALDEAKSHIDEAAVAAGRDPSTIGMNSYVTWGDRGLDGVVDHLGRWRAAGATHVSLNTMNAGFGASVDKHLEALAAIADAVGLR